MSLMVLVDGTLTADPQRRTGASGREFVTALLRCATEDEPMLVSVICFDPDACATLAGLRKGDSCSITGRAKLSSWNGRDGEQRHGLSVVAERVLTPYQAKRERQARARERAAREPAGAPFDEWA